MGSAGQYTGTCIKNRIYNMKLVSPNHDLVLLQEMSLFSIELEVMFSISAKTLQDLVIWLDLKSITRYSPTPNFVQ